MRDRCTEINTIVIDTVCTQLMPSNGFRLKRMGKFEITHLFTKKDVVAYIGLIYEKEMATPISNSCRQL